MESGETKSQALIRECQEELDITVCTGSVFAETTCAYSDVSIHLTLIQASILEGTPKKLEHKEIRWVSIHELSAYPFCPADCEFVEKLLRDGAIR